MSSKLEQLRKQNDGMYNNLVKNNVPFARGTAPNAANNNEEDALMEFYQNEQKQLKDALAEFRKQQPKPEPKPKAAPAVTKEPAKPKAAPKEADNDDEEENFVDKKPTYPTFTNMEDLKRSFCNDELDLFLKLVKEQPFFLYRANYKYASDMDKKPSYVARNFVKGFVKNLDDHRKYFFNCFRCYTNADNTAYTYPSWWVVNTSTPLSTVLGDYADDFEFTPVASDQQDAFLDEFKKVPKDSALVEEAYLH